MICNTCGAENKTKILMCCQCGAMLVDIYGQMDKSVSVELGEKAQHLNDFGELKESNFYIPQNNRTNRNSDIKKSLYNYLLKRAEEIVQIPIKRSSYSAPTARSVRFKRRGAPLLGL